MNIRDLKTYFETTPNPKFFLVDVFSWRGVYSEVAFEPSKEGSIEESLAVINRALNEEFRGYKDRYGRYVYSLDTEVHFERCSDEYTDCTSEEYLTNHFGGL